MNVTLQPDEKDALIQALSYYIPQLREEIGSTENYDMRQDMHAQVVALTGLLTRIGGSIADTDMPNVGTKNPPWGSVGR